MAPPPDPPRRAHHFPRQGHVEPEHRRAPPPAGRTHRESSRRQAAWTCASPPCPPTTANPSCSGCSTARRSTSTSKTSACPTHIYDYIIDTIEKPNGIFIVTGPTGAGKTTTLYAALSRINTIDSKLLTAEDPVEYDIDGIIQVPVNEAIGLDLPARPPRLPPSGPGPDHGRGNARHGNRHRSPSRPR